MDDHTEPAARFETHRTHPKAVAYRILGSLGHPLDSWNRHPYTRRATHRSISMSRIQPSTEHVVAHLAQIGACWSPSFAPDGRHVAFISDLSGLPQVWTVAASGGWPQLVTALPDQIVAVLWSPDGEWLAFQLAPGGGLNQQIWLVRPDGSALRRLTDGGTDNNWLAAWSHDGRRLAIASSRRSPDGDGCVCRRCQLRPPSADQPQPRYRHVYRPQPRRPLRRAVPHGKPQRRQSPAGGSRKRRGAVTDAAPGSGQLRQRSFRARRTRDLLSLECRPRADGLCTQPARHPQSSRADRGAGRACRR